MNAHGVLFILHFLFRPPKSYYLYMFYIILSAAIGGVKRFLILIDSLISMKINDLKKEFSFHGNIGSHFIF